MDKELMYDVFLYIQEYDRYATISSFECVEDSGNFIVKYNYLDNGELKNKSCKVSQIAFNKWLERRNDQDLIDNGITEL